ncbi:hypothetical protein OE88DRAFT_1711627 [Heliocybe sulcata]|uniref:Trafficking protein particle complex II-specific subunit 65 IgD3 domain-containing protein n=1 Tax=Heliocybe sulcata TaxID=5364 RepID=A0A5C3NBJ1_9AGAM|nr:hypothetical protein OE88DRAFT_1711627 [Heliocybe sulcata]
MLEELFSASTLEVLVPQASFVLPTQGPDDCLEQLRKSEERKTAFFDEKLQFLLLLRLYHPGSDGSWDPEHPPAELLSFLSQLQVSYEATYIPAAPAATSPGTPMGGAMRLSAPPRAMSLNKMKGKPPSTLHPTIFPPNTPNPTPLTADKDRRYVQAEGTFLSAGIWGEDSSEDSPETFALLWSSKDQVWTAVYKLVVTVSFLRMNFSDPLLCLTASTTLREKALPMTKARQPLADLITAVGDTSSAEGAASTATSGGADAEDDDTFDLHGLEEVNLLEGLATGPTFPREGPDRLYLPSTRLGTTIRKQAFSLHSTFDSPPSPTSAPSPKTSQPLPTLRKSFRKILQTVSGFRVRMRSVFVPYVLLPEITSGELDDEERERREAGTEERTVVLCVEVQNSGESGMGFAVEAVDVSISGEGAKARFIGWGQSQFPLLVGSMEQFNVLYAVTFWQAEDGGEGDLQRAVSINIHGRPFEASGELSSDLTPEGLVYPSQPFASRWNCVVDLSPNRARDSLDLANIDMSTFTIQDALPAPASPFPQVSTPRTASMPLLSAQEKTATMQQQSQLQSVAGSKRHTLAAIGSGPRSSFPFGPHGKSNLTPVNYRSSTSMLNPANQRDSLQPRSAFLPPSLALQQSAPRTPTTFSPRISSPPLPPPPMSPDSIESGGGQFASLPVVPPTPAYPAYPNSPLPHTPYSQAPIGSQGGTIGPSVDIGRQRGVGLPGQYPPQTPGPRLMGAGFADRGMGMGAMQLQNLQDKTVKEPIVVSIGLLPIETERDGDDLSARIFPLDRFTLDIFVFNQSSWIRRFEVSHPERRRGRRREFDRRSADYFPPQEKEKTKVDAGPGIMPLENRIRVGPLRPSTCQSVRMEFLALAPGVHTIDTLILTDIESGKSMNLRSVMDIVVHDPSDA